MKSKWNDIEMILTLYVYLTHEPKELHKNSEFLIEFSKRLFNYTGNIRTPASIEMRISNYKSVDPNYKKTGLANGGKSVIEFWDKYHNDIPYMENLYTNFINNTNEDISDETIKELDSIEEETKYLTDNTDKIDAYVKTALNVRNNKIQTTFRKNLIMEFNQKCAICGINKSEILIASHILPYSKCENKTDMISHSNGLLLCPNHDALFDGALLTFDSTGKIIISDKIPKEIYKDLNINPTIKLSSKYMTTERMKFLKQHNKIFEEKNRR